MRPRRYGPGMGLLVYLIVLAFSGLIVGGLARLALPGPDPMSIWMTILIGLAGSFIGGLVMLVITGGRNAGGSSSRSRGDADRLPHPPPARGASPTRAWARATALVAGCTARVSSTRERTPSFA